MPTTERGARMPRHGHARRAACAGARGAGFTLIELVAVMVIVAVLAVFAMPRLGTTGFDRYAFRHELVSALRYAQKTAMASGCDVAVTLDAAAESYGVEYRQGGSTSDCGAGAWGEPVAHPAGGGGYTGKAGAGADLQTGGRVEFDGYGNRRNGPTSIALAGGPAIQIDAVTGYVHE